MLITSMAKYEPSLVKSIIKDIAEGATFKDACDLAGITFETFNTWRKDPSKPEFSEGIKKALIKFKQTHLKNVSKAGAKGVWQASAWVLERKFPEEFGRNPLANNEVKITVAIGEGKDAVTDEAEAKRIFDMY